LILDDIVEKVLSRLAERKSRVSMQDLKNRLQDVGPARNFLDRIRRKEKELIRVIAEVKKASPSKGVIRHDFDPVRIAQEYEKNGASAVSVLTEEDYFLGRPDFLERIRKTVEVPLLRKDFILEPYQVLESRVLGADAFLLIVSLLSVELLEALILQGEALGMTALVEVHSEEELEQALHSPARIIGINNRDLKTFATDIEQTFRLIEKIPEEKIVVSESGIHSSGDLKRLENAGVDAVLVGEALMRSPQPGEKLRELLDY
jgi:indole-3-glycerol phosphate synthase